MLKRKTEEADLARKRIRELLELQQRNRQARSEVTAGLEVQPNAGAPLLRSEKARRDWIEQELDLCNTSWEYQKVSLLGSSCFSFNLYKQFINQHADHGNLAA